MIDLRRRRQQVSAAQGRSIAVSLRRLVYPFLALLLLVGVTAVGALQIETNEVNWLTLAISPAFDANAQVLQAMTDAETGLHGYQVSHDPELLTPYRGAEARTMAALATLQDKIVLTARYDDNDDTAQHASLEGRQRLAVEQWWAYALSIEQAAVRGERTDVLQRPALFDSFRRANATLGEHLTTERDQARSTARTTAATGTAVSIAATLAALLAALVLGYRFARSLSRPIIELRDTMTRQHGGESGARAREDQGPLEIRSLAAAFNALTEHNLGLNTELTHRTLHDPLTGLPNRTLLADRLGQALRADARMGSSTGLLLLDLDRFKEINDTFGHLYGDELLRQIGPRLAGVVRDADTIGRLAGDEFVVLLPDIGSVADAAAVAAKLRAALETPFHVKGIDLDVEASVGVVVSGEHSQDPATLLQHADVAMYAAKTQNLGVCVYDPDLDEHSPAKLALFGDLRRALDRGELVLHYQPKVGISTGDVVGVEALVRWQHPEHGLVFPDEFIPFAEHTGLIGPLTRHVLDTACAKARTWSDAGRPLPVSVNLSARNLLDVGLPGQVAELLAAHGIAAELLELEVTESAIMTEPARAQQLLEQLATLGVRISIDDFGVGHTCLLYTSPSPR